MHRRATSWEGCSPLRQRSVFWAGRQLDRRDRYWILRPPSSRTRSISHRRTIAGFRWSQSRMSSAVMHSSRRSRRPRSRSCRFCLTERRSWSRQGNSLAMFANNRGGRGGTPSHHKAARQVVLSRPLKRRRRGFRSEEAESPPLVAPGPCTATGRASSRCRDCPVAAGASRSRAPCPCASR